MPKRLTYTRTEKDIRIDEIFHSIKFLALRQVHPDFETYTAWITRYYQVAKSHETLLAPEAYLPSALGFPTRDVPWTVEAWIQDVREENQRRINDGMGAKAVKDLWAPIETIG